MENNPWLSAAPAQPAQMLDTTSNSPASHEAQDAPEPSGIARPNGPQAPQPFIPPGPGPALPARHAPGPAQLWWMGVHGGAGETTLAALSPVGRAAEHAWPVTEFGQHAVVLVTRTHHYGLMGARQAAIEWARGEISVRLIGLTLVADAPGRIPKPLRDLTDLVVGAVPRIWNIPWVEAWRMAPADIQTAPRAVRRLLAETTALTATTS